MQRAKLEKRLRLTFYSLALIIVCAICAFPYYWLISSSFKGFREISSIPVTLFPHAWTIHNYVLVLTRSSFVYYVRNSFIVASATSIICVVLAAFAAYGIARTRMRGYQVVLGFVLMLAMLPGIAILAPLYKILVSLRLLNTYLALILPYVAFTLPFSIWYLANFLKSFPPALEDAAMIDGCTPVQAMTKVIFPIAVPGLVGIGLLNFIGAWNEFMFALVLTQTTAARTGVVGIYLMRGLHEVPWGPFCAAMGIISIPIVVLALVGQRWLMRSLMSGVIKG